MRDRRGRMGQAKGTEKKARSGKEGRSASLSTTKGRRVGGNGGPRVELG